MCMLTQTYSDIIAAGDTIILDSQFSIHTIKFFKGVNYHG